MSYYNNGGYRRGGKRRRGGRRRGGRRRNGGGSFTYGNVMDKVIRDVSRLKGLINVEFKKVDTFREIPITIVAPQIGLLNGMAIGDDFTNREGRSVRIKSLQIALTLFLNPLSTQTFVRCILVLDTQPNGIIMLIDELLNDATVNLGSTNFRNLNFRKRFVILKDEVVTLQASGQRSVHLEWYKKLNIIETFDDSSTGGIGDITTNALYLVLFSGETTDGVQNSCRTRVRFIDN